MKYLIYLLISQLILLSCNNHKNEKLSFENHKELSSNVYENYKTEERFSNLKNTLIVVDDTLGNRNFIENKYKEIDCDCKLISESDFENQNNGDFLREYSITFQDTIEIKVLQKINKTSEYIYAYKKKALKVKNFYGQMFSKNADLLFDFDNRRCYKISANKFLMREQPIRWCGLSNQFDVFQIVDLDNFEMTQFVDKDNKLD